MNTIREHLEAAFWEDNDLLSEAQAARLAEVVLWRFDVAPKGSHAALVDALKAALAASHDPTVERIVQEGLAEAEAKLAALQPVSV